MILEQYNMEQKVVIFALILILAKVILDFLLKKYSKNENSKKIFLELLDWVKTGFSALWIAFLIMYFVIQAFKIPSGSMENTLQIKDHLLVNKFYYGVRLPTLKISTQKTNLGKSLKIKDDVYVNLEMKRFLVKNEVQRGDQVVFAFPGDTSKDFIKRCIAVPGDKIEMIDKVLYINDIEQVESYAVHKDINIYHKDDFVPDEAIIRDNFGPIVLPKDYYFMMGDNRDNSYDSRFWGPLHKNYVKGKPICIFYPLNRIALLKSSK
jgi:signal peptidase I